MRASNIDGSAFKFLSRREYPLAYTKLSCFLPWVADQFGLSFESAVDESCVKGTGQEPPYTATCRETRESGETEYVPTEEESQNSTSTRPPPPTEYPCIFPFYFDGKLFES